MQPEPSDLPHQRGPPIVDFLPVNSSVTDGYVQLATPKELVTALAAQHATWSMIPINALADLVSHRVPSLRCCSFMVSTQPSGMLLCVQLS